MHTKNIQFGKWTLKYAVILIHSDYNKNVFAIDPEKDMSIHVLGLSYINSLSKQIRSFFFSKGLFFQSMVVRLGFELVSDYPSQSRIPSILSTTSNWSQEVHI